MGKFRAITPVETVNSQLWPKASFNRLKASMSLIEQEREIASKASRHNQIALKNILHQTERNQSQIPNALTCLTDLPPSGRRGLRGHLVPSGVGIHFRPELSTSLAILHRNTFTYKPVYTHHSLSFTK